MWLFARGSAESLPSDGRSIQPTIGATARKCGHLAKCTPWRSVVLTPPGVRWYGLPQAPNMPATSKGTAHTSARADITRAAHWSTLATFRSIQQVTASYNTIVITQTTQAQNHKQRKRDNANNVSVMLANMSSRHNAIVISRSCAQAFVTKRNISFAYLSHRLSLLVQAYYVTIENWHKYACTTVRLYYVAMRIQRYRHMIICAYAHKSIKQ